MDDRQFKTILEFFQLSQKGYRKVRKGVKKRLVRHMAASGCKNASDYLAMLQNNPASMHECRLALTVSISRFFRDRALWETIGKRVLPDLAGAGLETIHAWSAGCARGEEAYSLAMIQEKAARKGPLPRLDLLATDICPDYLSAARKGVYGRTSVKEVDESDRIAFFHIRKNGNRFIVKDFLRDKITWRIMDLCTDPPARSFDLIFLRNNILTYLDGDFRNRVFESILQKLKPGGFFIKGSHETIPGTGVRLSRAYEKGSPFIFRTSASG